MHPADLQLHVSADILVPSGRPGAQIQESDLLHAGVHRAAVYMCQPLLPRCQVKAEPRKASGNKGTRGLHEQDQREGVT